MALASELIDQSKLVSNNRRNAAIADADWIIFLNWAIESWYKFRIALDPALYFSTRDIVVAGGISGSAIDLTTGFSPLFRTLHGVDVNPDTAARRTVTARGFRQRNETVGWWTPAPTCDVRKYDMRAYSLVITPYETAAGTYRVYYRGAPHSLTGPSDTTPMDFVLEPEAVVLLAACHALRVEETSDDPWNKRLAVIKAEVIAQYDRDDGEPSKIQDVEDLGWYGP